MLTRQNAVRGVERQDDEIGLETGRDRQRPGDVVGEDEGISAVLRKRLSDAVAVLRLRRYDEEKVASQACILSPGLDIGMAGAGTVTMESLTREPGVRFNSPMWAARNTVRFPR